MLDSFEKYLYQTVFPMQPPENIYHYTTQKGILGIVTRREMWATQVHFLNDKNEVFLTFKPGADPRYQGNSQQYQTQSAPHRSGAYLHRLILRRERSAQPVARLRQSGQRLRHRFQPQGTDSYRQTPAFRSLALRLQHRPADGTGDLSYR